MTPELRAAELISFLGRWLDLLATDHALLWDMIRHEQAIARLNRPAVASPYCATPVDLSATTGTNGVQRAQHLRRGDPA